MHPVTSCSQARRPWGSRPARLPASACGHHARRFTSCRQGFIADSHFSQTRPRGTWGWRFVEDCPEHWGVGGGLAAPRRRLQPTVRSEARATADTRWQRMLREERFRGSRGRPRTASREGARRCRILGGTAILTAAPLPAHPGWRHPGPCGWRPAGAGAGPERAPREADGDRARCPPGPVQDPSTQRRHSALPASLGSCLSSGLSSRPRLQKVLCHPDTAPPHGRSLLPGLPILLTGGLGSLPPTHTDPRSPVGRPHLWIPQMLAVPKETAFPARQGRPAGGARESGARAPSQLRACTRVLLPRRRVCEADGRWPVWEGERAIVTHAF